MIWLQNFSGYPVWLLATLSYLLSEDGVSGRDCIDGDGCNTDCSRSVPPFNLLNPNVPLIGGFRLVCTKFNFSDHRCMHSNFMTSRHLTVNLDACCNLNRLLLPHVQRTV